VIIEWLMGVATGLWEFIGSLLPDWELPPELADPNGFLGQVFALGQGLEPFINWSLVGMLGAIPLAVWVIGILWRATRMLLSHIPLFGGN